jgi:hypothetical protein
MDIIFIFKVKHQFDRYYQNPKCPHLDSSHTPHFNHIDPCIPVKENTVDPVIMFGKPNTFPKGCPNFLQSPSSHSQQRRAPVANNSIYTLSQYISHHYR